mgnify:CR=1 FL=1
MISFLNNNKSLVKYSLILLIIIPIFGFNFLISLIGNIFLLFLLIPLLILIVLLISFNSLKRKMKICNQCGTISFGGNDRCVNCGSNLNDTNIESFENSNNPGGETIEIKAEEIK